MSKDGNRGKGVFNGDVGQITSLDAEEECAVVTFEDGRIADYTFEDMRHLMLAYAITVHKSQGSEYPVVIIPLFRYGVPMLFNRNLLYTAVTRAAKAVIFIGESGVADKMIKNNYSKKRYSGLIDAIRERM